MGDLKNFIEICEYPGGHKKAFEMFCEQSRSQKSTAINVDLVDQKRVSKIPEKSVENEI